MYRSQKEGIMKKIILILLIIFTTPVYANDLESWQETKINDENLIEEVQYRYKWYKEEKIGEYLKENTKNYKYIDKDNIKYGEYSTYLKTCPNNEWTEIKYEKLYPYQTLKKIKYLKFNVTYNPIVINNIEIYINNERTYDYYTTYNGKSTYYNNSNLEFIFNQEYDASDIKIVLDSDIKYPYQDIVTASYYTIDNKELFKTHFRNNKESVIVNPLIEEYTNEIKYEKSIANIEKIKWAKIYILENLCKYRYKYQYYYNINKQYYDDNYYTNIDGYIKDESNFKIFYRYTKKQEVIKNNNLNIEKNSNKKAENNIDNSLIKTNKNNETIITPLKITEQKPSNKLINELKINTKIDNIYIILSITFLILGISIIMFKKYVKKKKYMI